MHTFSQMRLICLTLGNFQYKKNAELQGTRVQHLVGSKCRCYEPGGVAFPIISKYTNWLKYLPGMRAGPAWCDHAVGRFDRAKKVAYGLLSVPPP